MTAHHSKSLREPDETVRFPLVTQDLVDLGDVTVGRTIQQPGWRWSVHTRPLVGGDLCEARHVGVVISGRFGVVLRDGTTLEFGPDDAYDIPPGHDGYTIGDQPCVMIEWTGLRAFAGFKPGPRGRVLATLLLTDVADVGEVAARLGDVAWREMVSTHLEATRSALERFGGREVKTTVDGLLATFDGPAQAIRCADAIRAATAPSRIRVRSAVHVGEVDLVRSDIRGLSVAVVARMLALARGDEIVASEITRSLALAAGLTFEPRGTVALDGLPGEWPLFLYEGGGSGAATG